MEWLSKHIKSIKRRFERDILGSVLKLVSICLVIIAGVLFTLGFAVKESAGEETFYINTDSKEADHKQGSNTAKQNEKQSEKQSKKQSQKQSEKQSEKQSNDSSEGRTGEKTEKADTNTEKTEGKEETDTNTRMIKPKEKININTATREELMTLKGIGGTRADAIIDYREKNGPFKTIEQIMEITGIKEGIFSKICEGICVE